MSACGEQLESRRFIPTALQPTPAILRLVAEADKRAEATPFIEFMLEALLDAIAESVSTDQVARLLKVLAAGELGSSNLMSALDLSLRPTFRKNYLDPALDGGWIERTQPDSPRSPTQRYLLTDKARRWPKRHEEE